jgi:hypothetical protein
MHDTDLGLLIDFLRGELDSTAAAEVRARLEHEDALFQLFERLRRTYAVLRSLPAVAPASGEVVQPESIPLTAPRAAFVADVRREFNTRGWAGMIPMLAARSEYVRALRVEFTVRAVTGCLPMIAAGTSFLESLRLEFASRAGVLALPFIKARPEWVRALRIDFNLRAVMTSLPLLEVRPEFAASLRAEFRQRALLASVPAMDVRAGFERRLKVALVEAAREVPAVAADRPALPVVDATDPFRRRLFNRIRMSGRRKVRETPVRVDIDEYKLGREFKRGVKRSRGSVAFTLSLHVLAIVIMLFIFARPEVSTVSAYVAQGQSSNIVAPPEMRTDEMGTGQRPPARETPYVTIIDDDDSMARDEIPFGPLDDPAPERRDDTSQELPEPQRKPDPATDTAARNHLGDGGPTYFRLRGAPRQQKIDYLGSVELYETLDKALSWLVLRQLGDGSWGHVNVDAVIIPRDRDRREIQKLELTTASLLALLGDGHSSQASPAGYQEAVNNGISWLLTQQRESGQIGPVALGNVMVHAMATLALAEEFGLTRDHRLREPLRKACRWLCNVRAEGSAGFPSQLGNEASLTTGVWAYLALATARNVKVPPIDLPQLRVDEFLEWFNVQTRGSRSLTDSSVLVNTDLPLSAAASALGLFATEVGYENRTQSYLGRINRAAPNLNVEANADRRGDLGDMRYVFFGTMAQALNLQRHGNRSNDWYDAFSRSAIASQRADGSYAATSTYSDLYGEVFQTAFTALSIENAYRVTVINK